MVTSAIVSVKPLRHHSVLTVSHWRIRRRGLGINLVFCQGRSMLADLELRADVLQHLI